MKDEKLTIEEILADETALNEYLEHREDDDVVQAHESSLEEIIERAVETAVEKAFGKVLKKAESKLAEIVENANQSFQGVQLQSAVTGETGRETPDKRVDFSKLSYSELCSFLEQHPKAKL